MHPRWKTLPLHGCRDVQGFSVSLSYWLDQAPQHLSHTHETKFDVVIVGAGISGVSTAYWLEKKDPTLKIAIIEKNELGSGASGRNAGFVTCGSAEHFAKLVEKFNLDKAIEIWKFSEENRELLKTEIIQNDFNSVLFKSTGSCTVAPSQADWQRYQNIYEQMKAAGIDVELINEKYLESEYGVRNFQGAIQYVHDGVIHPIKLLNKIKSKLKSTVFFFQEEVKEIEKKMASFEIQTNNKIIFADKVFVCLNGFATAVLPELQKHLKPQRGQVIVTEKLPSFVKGPCYLTKHLCYFRQLSSGELLVGGFRNVDLESENTAVDQTTDKIQNALTDFTQSYFNKTQNIKINYRWSGIMGFTDDGQMLIGEHPRKPGLFLMAGCSGHGMGLCFNSARHMVENSYGQKMPSHLDLNRIQL